jgi:hypothetical protein
MLEFYLKSYIPEKYCFAKGAITMLINSNVDKYGRETSEYIVAYLDLLGVSTRMKTDKEYQKMLMNKLHNLYTTSIRLSKEIAIKGYNEIQFKIFSDNIIISKRLSKDYAERMLDIKCVLNCASHFACSSVGDGVGWLVRGGITIGELFIDDTMVWGNALLKAYNLENNIAIYPRIVIDSEILHELGNDKTLHEYIQQDFDNIVFLNYLSIWHFGGLMLMNGFNMMQDELRGKYTERVYQKYCWHMNYVNRELDKKNEREDRKYRLRLR